jgi:hypothetical protein
VTAYFRAETMRSLITGGFGVGPRGETVCIPERKRTLSDISVRPGTDIDLRYGEQRKDSGCAANDVRSCNLN